MRAQCAPDSPAVDEDKEREVKKLGGSDKELW